MGGRRGSDRADGARVCSSAFLLEMGRIKENGRGCRQGGVFIRVSSCKVRSCRCGCVPFSSRFLACAVIHALFHGHGDTVMRGCSV
jgi:hypothetical protein